MRPETSATLFAPDQPVSPYLVDWRRAFAALDPAVAAPAEIWFDRGPYPPLVERLLLPTRPDARDRRIVERHLSALINNVLCTAGAKRVSIRAEAGFDPAMLAAVRANLLTRLDGFSIMSLHFIHGLVQSVFGAHLDIDADWSQVEALRQRAGNDAATFSNAAPARPPRPGTALAVNIGQHLTSWGLVRFTDDGEGVVTNLSRRETCPTGAPCCLTQEFRDIMAAVRSTLGREAEAAQAVGLSIAATVMDETLLPVPEFGLFAGCPPPFLMDATGVLRRTCQEVFPGRPVAVVNDAKAQALFAFHQAGGRQAAGDGHMLAVRLGACPCVHCLDPNGQSAPGFDEYGWLATRACADQPGMPLFSTPRLPLSHYGVAAAAHELGLLALHNCDVEEAIPFFYDRLTGNDPHACQEAAAVYGSLGEHLAMLAAEIHIRRPIGAIMVLGSTANRLDRPVFEAMRHGYAAFAAHRSLVPGRANLVLVEDASAHAGLLGAARAALAAPTAVASSV